VPKRFIKTLTVTGAKTVERDREIVHPNARHVVSLAQQRATLLLRQCGDRVESEISHHALQRIVLALGLPQILRVFGFHASVLIAPAVPDRLCDLEVGWPRTGGQRRRYRPIGRVAYRADHGDGSFDDSPRDGDPNCRAKTLTALMLEEESRFCDGKWLMAPTVDREARRGETT
jgi:hypothetical protein